MGLTCKARLWPRRVQRSPKWVIVNVLPFRADLPTAVSVQCFGASWKCWTLVLLRQRWLLFTLLDSVLYLRIHRLVLLIRRLKSEGAHPHHTLSVGARHHPHVVATDTAGTREDATDIMTGREIEEMVPGVEGQGRERMITSMEKERRREEERGSVVAAGTGEGTVSVRTGGRKGVVTTGRVDLVQSTLSTEDHRPQHVRARHLRHGGSRRICTLADEAAYLLLVALTSWKGVSISLLLVAVN